MSESDRDSPLPDCFQGCTDLRDIFLVTQGGVLRRVTVPLDMLAIICWLMAPGGTPHGNIDGHVCRGASEKGCGYAEAFLNFMHSMRDDEVWGHCYRLALEDEAFWTATKQRFSDDQAEKEKAWRTEHKDWRDPLPPALD